MKAILCVIGVLLALAGSAALVFIANLYAPRWFWVVSFVIIALALLIKAVIYPTFRSAVLAAICTVIVNGHFLFLSVSAPNPQLIGYFLAFILGQFCLLYFSFWMIERLRAPRTAK